MIREPLLRIPWLNVQHKAPRAAIDLDVGVGRFALLLHILAVAQRDPEYDDRHGRSVDDIDVVDGSAAHPFFSGCCDRVGAGGEIDSLTLRGAACQKNREKDFRRMHKTFRGRDGNCNQLSGEST